MGNDTSTESKSKAEPTITATSKQPVSPKKPQRPVSPPPNNQNNRPLSPRNNGGNSSSNSNTDALSEFGAKMTAKLSVDDFELLSVVGKGSFGKVMQVRKKDTNKIYAMKVLKKAQLLARKQIAHTHTERKVLEEIDHPFVVSLRFAFQTEDKLYMVLDYFTGGELFYHLKNQGKFVEDRVRLYAAEIILALECLHKNNIIYRDLKPENILLDDSGHLRLTDFGLSKESIEGDKVAHTFCGTPEYLAPEVLQGHGHGKAVDWWSLGTLLYEMITGLPPYYNTNVNTMYEKILHAKLSFPAFVSPNTRSLLTGLIERDVKKRLGSGPEDAEEIKKHPFFAELDWNKVYNMEYEPIFKPKVSGDMDISNVDKEFKQEVPKDTPVQASHLGTVVDFQGFTYNPDSRLALSDD